MGVLTGITRTGIIRSIGMAPIGPHTPMWTRNRRLSAVVAAGYVLALATAALVHNHAGGDSGCCGGHAVHTPAGNHGPGGSRGGHEDGQPGPAIPAGIPPRTAIAPPASFWPRSRALTAVCAGGVGRAGARGCGFLAGACRLRRLFGLAEPCPARFRVNFSPLV